MKISSINYSMPTKNANFAAKAKKTENKVSNVGMNNDKLVMDGNASKYFKLVDNLITNFHLPKSTLIMLISALAGRENVLNAYKIAVDNKYRFFSFGDSMFIIDKK